MTDAPPPLSGAAAFLVALGLAVPAAAADAARGRELAGPCRVCHGLDGVGAQPGMPHLAGQPAEYLAKALADYRDGRREDPQMSIMAATLSDADIADLAAWYASIEVTVTPPE